MRDAGVAEKLSEKNVLSTGSLHKLISSDIDSPASHHSG